MDYLQTLGEHTHNLPIAAFIIMFLIMTLCIFVFFRRRSGNSWFQRSWGRGFFAACCGPNRFNTPLDILRERYASGEINKEEFEGMKRDISETD